MTSVFPAPFCNRCPSPYGTFHAAHPRFTIHDLGSPLADGLPLSGQVVVMKPPICVSPAPAAPAVSPPSAPNRTAVPCRRLLIVDDDPADVFLARQALSLFDEWLQIDDVSDGQQALDYLRQRGHEAGPPLPHFLLLDINMPRLNGLETLQAIRHDERLKSLPVIILTTSTAPNDVQRAWDLQATCYLSKQLELDAFTRQLQHLAAFWGEAVCYPE